MSSGTNIIHTKFWILDNKKFLAELKKVLRVHHEEPLQVLTRTFFF